MKTFNGLDLEISNLIQLNKLNKIIYIFFLINIYIFNTMANFYTDLSVLGKVIFWVGVIVIFCSIFTQCIFCEYVPFRVQMNSSFNPFSSTNSGSEQSVKPVQRANLQEEQVVVPNVSNVNEARRPLSPMNSFTNTLYDYFEDMDEEDNDE